MWPFVKERKRSVIVADDDPSARVMLCVFLGSEGWNVVEAANGQQCLDAAAASAPELILLDVDMPVMNGITVLTILRANPKTAKVPVVMVTGRSTIADVEQALLAGAVDYVTKPIELAMLKVKLAKLFRASGP